MNVWPLRFREIGADHLLFVDDAGGFFVSDTAFLERYARDRLTPPDIRFLRDSGHAYADPADLAFTAFAYRWANRLHAAGSIAYLILVPTLRCNLSCAYCQVARAPEAAQGYDWTPQTERAVLGFLEGLESEEIKVEFQGGEPMLRMDILDRVRSFCRGRFRKAEFVVCTNLQVLGPPHLAFLEAEDTFVSTSLDGSPATHDRQRTRDPTLAAAFSRNLHEVMRRLGPDRVSALPTIDPASPPTFGELVEAYEEFGISSIYLRPVNYHGFARRRPPAADELAWWTQFHAGFIDFLIDRNFRTGTVVEEFYFSHCLRRVLRLGIDGHVDLRNPNLLGSDYVVVDYDGRLYPTDEARMLARIGRIDLAIGDVGTGIDRVRARALSEASVNNFEPDCIHCPYQPFCGTDVVDDVCRYGRIDVPKLGTWFCGRQLAIFDKIFALIYADDERVGYSLSRWSRIVSWPRQIAPVHHDPASHPG